MIVVGDRQSVVGFPTLRQKRANGGPNPPLVDFSCLRGTKSIMDSIKSFLAVLPCERFFNMLTAFIPGEELAIKKG